jgi:UDP-N-acetylmuramyl pentapeptide phosphotransferase/UDP-N-acetylglucosamine-1-phosphate transferase
MDATTTIPTLVALGASLLAALVLVPFARRAGWVDGGASERKRAVEPLPLCGGAIVLAGVLAGWVAMELGGRAQAGFVPGRELRELVSAALGREVTLWPLGALLLAFAIGTLDDLLEDGLRPAQKLAGQAAVGVVLALPVVMAAPQDPRAWAVLALAVLAACVVLNLVNTFDNADGAASGLGCAAALGSAPFFAAALAAFLPFNLARRGRAPRAILGDAGSHALGLLLLLEPAAWPALALPALDLGRLVLVRARLGRAPWQGDRRHLAHRLQARGLAPVQVALVLLGLSLPALLLGWPGVPLVAVGFALALRFAPAPHEVRPAPSRAALSPVTTADEPG